MGRPSGELTRRKTRSHFEKQLDRAPTFEAACQLAHTTYRETARKLARECKAAGLPYDDLFWHEAARDALRAVKMKLAQYYADQPEAAAHRMRQRGLACFADALETGCYREHLGF